jgi:hypothetical protein
MIGFTTQKNITAHTRISGYVGNLSQSTTVTTGPASCYLRPLSEIESSNNGFQYGVAHNAIFEVGEDIQEQDKITIDGTEFTVKGVIDHSRGYATGYIKALIIKPQQ